MTALQSSTPENPSQLVAFAAARSRPALFLILNESLERPHLWKIRRLLGDSKFDELDIVIHSGGGSINVAYQIIGLLRLHTDELYACVPLYAKSAATLLCLGTDELFIDILAELGPLDAQIYEDLGGGKHEHTSALNPFKTLEQLQRFSLETLDIAVKMIVSRSRMDLDECLRHAIEFVRGATEPLFSQLNPEKLGHYSRALAVGSEYGDRLLRRFTSWDRARREGVLEQLVRGYPSHDYIIDFEELKEMGFRVSLFSESQHEAVEELIDYILEGNSTIALVTPEDQDLE